MDGDGLVNEVERARALAAASSEAVVILDDERRVVASNVERLQPGRRVGDVEDALVLFLGGLPELSAYQELRAGVTAAVSHELRAPLARPLVLLQSAGLPNGGVAALVGRARAGLE